MAVVVCAGAAVSLACDDRRVAAFLAGYLRYLKPGLAHLARYRFHIEFKVVVPDGVPRLPAAAAPVCWHRNYRTATLAGDLFYHTERGAYLCITPAASQAMIWVSGDTASDEEFLMELVSVALLELGRHRAFYGLHTAAVTQDGAGYLLPGPSGSGKTSLALAFVLKGGFRYLTDDFVLLTKAPDGIRCVPVFRTFNVDPRWVEHYTELSILKKRPPGARGKRHVDPGQLYPGSHAGECRPAFIVFPRIVPARESTLRPMPKTGAFQRLLRESALSPHGPVARQQLEALGSLVRQCGTYEFLHGRDFLDDPGRTIATLLERMHSRPEGPSP